MKTRILWGVLGICVPVCGAALAADNAMSAYYEATLERATDTSESRTWYDQDGTLKRFSYEMTKPQGSFTVWGQEGKYRFAGGKICETIVPSTKEACADFTPHKIGDAWDATESGVTYHYKLVAGRTTH